MMEVCLAITECPDIICNESSMNGSVCAKWDEKSLILNKCKEDEICVLPLNITEDGNCQKIDETATLLPGEYCTNPKQCLYENECANNVCKGKKPNEDCTHDGNCDVELHCNSKKKCANSADSCSETEKCKSNQICLYGKCVILGQLEDGKESVVTGACRSYYIHDGKCTEGPKLHGNDKFMCPYTEQCRYYWTHNNSMFLSRCICSGDAAINAFCSPGQGDIDTSDVYVCVKIVCELHEFD